MTLCLEIKRPLPTVSYKPVVMLSICTLTFLGWFLCRQKYWLSRTQEATMAFEELDSVGAVRREGGVFGSEFEKDIVEELGLQNEVEASTFVSTFDDTLPDSSMSAFPEPTDMLEILNDVKKEGNPPLVNNGNGEAVAMMESPIDDFEIEKGQGPENVNEDIFEPLSKEITVGSPLGDTQTANPVKARNFVIAQSVQGMNNQLMTYMEAIQISKLTNRTLVKPVFCARPYTGLECYPLETYFDLASFASCISYVTIEEYNATDAMHNVSIVHFTRHGVRPYKKLVDAINWYAIPPSILKRKNTVFHLLDASDYSNTDELLNHPALGLQHQTLLFDCLLQDIPVHYPSYITCFEPRKEITDIVTDFISYHFGKQSYIAAHYRGQDFLEYCNKSWIQHDKLYACVLDVEEFINQVEQLQLLLGIPYVFIATDENGYIREAFKKKSWALLGEGPFSPSLLKLPDEPRSLGDTMMLIDQQLSVRAHSFIGNRFSTTSMNIIRRRKGENCSYFYK